MKQNNELIHYLNSGVNGIANDGIVGEITMQNIGFMEFENVLPLLYPLSVLTETINHEGVDEIPLVELAKIEGTYNGEEYKFVRDMLVWLNSDNKGILFRYSPTYQSFYKTINGNLYQSTFQLLLFQYFFSRRINPFPKLETKDPRELGDKNPYLITNKK